VLQLFIFRVVRGPFREDFYQCVTHGAYTARWQEQLYSTLSVLLMYVLPLITMIVSYTLIFCTVAKKSRHFQLGMHAAFDVGYLHDLSIVNVAIDQESL